MRAAAKEKEAEAVQRMPSSGSSSSTQLSLKKVSIELAYGQPNDPRALRIHRKISEMIALLLHVVNRMMAENLVEEDLVRT